MQMHRGKYNFLDARERVVCMHAAAASLNVHNRVAEYLLEDRRSRGNPCYWVIRSA